MSYRKKQDELNDLTENSKPDLNPPNLSRKTVRFACGEQRLQGNSPEYPKPEGLLYLVS